MNFLDLVTKRKSCRKYLNQAVPRESLNRCLEAARLAPSACNSQPWRFIVVTDLALKNKLADAAFGGIYKANAFAKDAGALVVVIREKTKYMMRVVGAFRGVQYSLLDLGIAVEHFVLQAEEEGLATCWIGWFDIKAVKKALGLGWNEQIDILISVGYAENPGVVAKNRKSLGEMSEFR